MPQAPSNSDQSGKPAQVRFEPRNLSLKTGQTMTVGVVVDNVSDLFSIPFLVQYNPAVISVGRSPAWWLPPGWGSRDRYRTESGQ